MKGMLDFLEKAGLVTRDPAPEPGLNLDVRPLATPERPDAAPATAPAPPTPPAAAPLPAGGSTVALDLDAIYARSGIAPAQYPAERLLRLVDGLAAMDAATRQMAIQAMDAADESWTIADPLADAQVKLQALSAHGQQLEHELQQIEQQTQVQLDLVASRQEQVVGEIRKQMAELQALIERELARAAQETATHQANLQAAREQTSQALAALAHTRTRLSSLAAQFAAPAATAQE